VAPSNIALAGAQWIEVDALEGKKMLASVFYPQGTGPFPVVVWLHATGGFQLNDVEMAQDFARAGFIGVAVGWFGGHYVGVQEITPVSFPEAIDWPDGPDINGSPATLINNIKSFINIVRTLPNARKDWIGLIGHSRGSAFSVATAESGADIQAVVALAGYPENTTLKGLYAPILILQGTADECINVDQAYAFEEKLQNLDKPVESHYYEGASHMFPYSAPWRDDMLQRAVAFFGKYLVP
jgi:dienelactone hydrolase